MEVVRARATQPGQPVFYLVRREAVITGRDLKNARAGVDQNNAPDVQFTLNPLGADKFKRETGATSAGAWPSSWTAAWPRRRPSRPRSATEGSITGRFTTQEADELAKVLRAGALPATLKYLQELTVGASLGKDSIRAGVIGLGRGHGLHHRLHARLLPALGRERGGGPPANLLILLGAMAYCGPP